MSSNYSFSASTPHYFKKMILIIGSFDGLHLGHYELFKKAYEYKSDDPDFAINVLTFSSPIEAFFTQKSILPIFNLEEKQIVLNQTSIDNAFFMEPTKDLFELTAKEFIEYLLKDNKEIHLIVSQDSRFGKDQAGHKELTQIANEIGSALSIDVVPLKLTKDQNKISSSLIKKYIEQGEIEKANDLLFSPYFIYGEIIKGDQKGRTLGFPTINIAFPDNKTLPPFGVYVSEVNIQGMFYPSLTYISDFKLDQNQGRIVTETWAPYYKGEEGKEFYGALTSVNLIKFIRPPSKVSSIDELKELVAKDKLTLDNS